MRIQDLSAAPWIAFRVIISHLSMKLTTFIFSFLLIFLINFELIKDIGGLLLKKREQSTMKNRGDVWVCWIPALGLSFCTSEISTGDRVSLWFLWNIWGWKEESHHPSPLPELRGRVYTSISRKGSQGLPGPTPRSTWSLWVPIWSLYIGNMCSSTGRFPKLLL